MNTGWIEESRAVEGAIMAMAMTMTMASVRRTPRVVRKRPEKGRDHRMGRGMGRRLRTGKGMGRGRGWQWRWGRGSGREMVKGNVMLDKPHGEMISLVPSLCSCRRKCI